MPPRNESADKVIARMESISRSVQGPGMSTTIRATELATGETIRTRSMRHTPGRRRLNGPRSGKRRETGTSAREGEGCGHVASPKPCSLESMPVFADLIENHAELWGEPLPVALATSFEQRPVDPGDVDPGDRSEAR